MESDVRSTDTTSAWVVAAVVVSAAVFVSTAWLADDALITLRQVEMFASGEGIVWNEGHRVQAFTHPTWFLLLSAGRAISGFLYEWAILLSGLCSITAMGLWARHCQQNAAPYWLLALPLLTESIPDYFSSGLENPLSFLLAGLIILLIGREASARRDMVLWLLLALAVMTRFDHALQFGPLALWLLVAGGVLTQIGRAVPSILLLVLWFGFATFYFGAPLPNTYYAKLGAELQPEALEYLRANYISAALFQTPATTILVGLGVLAGLAGGTRERLLALGIALHTAYLWKIGGDFMEGRMMALDALVGCYLIATVARRLPLAVPGALTAALVALLALRMVTTPVENSTGELHQVVDERRFYYVHYGLMSPQRGWPGLAATAPGQPEVSVTYTGCAFIGGRRLTFPSWVWIVDNCGLVDPFIARLPAAFDTAPTAGHFSRKTPLGYYDMVQTGVPVGLTEDETRLFDLTYKIATGPLFDRDRLAAIWTLHTENFDIPIEDWRDPDAGTDRMEPELQFWHPERPAGI